LINWSRPEPPPDLRITERSYFKIVKSDPEAKLILAEAARSHLDDEGLSVQRAQTGSRGEASVRRRRECGGGLKRVPSRIVGPPAYMTRQ
jgi:hypothetical protein